MSVTANQNTPEKVVPCVMHRLLAAAIDDAQIFYWRQDLIQLVQNAYKSRDNYHYRSKSRISYLQCQSWIQNGDSFSTKYQQQSRRGRQCR
jgi:hypothetical protein